MPRADARPARPPGTPGQRSRRVIGIIPAQRQRPRAASRLVRVPTTAGAEIRVNCSAGKSTHHHQSGRPSFPENASTKIRSGSSGSWGQLMNGFLPSNRDTVITSRVPSPSRSGAATMCATFHPRPWSRPASAGATASCRWHHRSAARPDCRQAAASPRCRQPRSPAARHRQGPRSASNRERWATFESLFQGIMVPIW